MDEQQLREVYEMVDNIPFSRVKRNITRDFADGVMMAQLIYYYRPKLVSLHNYPSANSIQKKINNWNTLNTKVLKKLGIPISKSHIEDIVNSVPNAIQTYLYTVLIKLQRPEEEVKLITHSGHREKGQKSQNRSVNHSNIQERQVNRKEEVKKGGFETDEISELVDEIEQTYTHLCKLQQMSKLKDEKIRNLQKKVDKMIFS